MAKNNGEVIYIVPLLIMADPDDHSLIPVASSALDISDYPLYVELDPEADYNPLLMCPQNQQWQVLELSAVSRLLMDPILDCIFEEDEEQVDEDDEVSGMAAVAGAGADSEEDLPKKKKKKKRKKSKATDDIPAAAKAGSTATAAVVAVDDEQVISH